MILRKIEAMHTLFGVLPEKRCENCTNLIQGKYHDRHYRKCMVYGATHSEATDWRKKYVACGMFDRDWMGKPIVKTARKATVTTEPCEGQMTMEGEAGT